MLSVREILGGFGLPPIWAHEIERERIAYLSLSLSLLHYMAYADDDTNFFYQLWKKILSGRSKHGNVVLTSLWKLIHMWECGVVWKGTSDPYNISPINSSKSIQDFLNELNNINSEWQKKSWSPNLFNAFFWESNRFPVGGLD